MTKEFRNSGEERKTNDRYFTPSWCSELILPFIPEYVKSGFILEPSAGRGDMTRVFVENGYDVMSGDIDISEFDNELGSVVQQDFLEMESWEIDDSVKAVITNPPYKNRMAEKFVAHAITMPVDFIAMFLRSEFNTSSRRMDLWDRQKNPFAYEIVLCGTRPRWDWWLPDPEPWEEPRNSPMHMYSWFVWDKNWEGPRTQFFVSKGGDNDSEVPE